MIIRWGRIGEEARNMESSPLEPSNVIELESEATTAVLKAPGVLERVLRDIRDQHPRAALYQTNRLAT